MKKKILSILLVMFVLLVVSTGCSKDHKSTEKDNTSKTKTHQLKNNDIRQDKNLTKKVKDEKGVLNGQVYKQNGMVIGTLVLDNKVSDKDAKALAQKYVNELKSKYKDKKVNVQAVRDGKNVANITKD